MNILPKLCPGLAWMVLAGGYVLYAHDALAQDASGACAVTIQLGDQPLATGIIIVDSYGDPLKLDGIDGESTRLARGLDADRLRPCGGDQIARAGTGGIWIDVQDLSRAACCQGKHFEVDRTSLRAATGDRRQQIDKSSPTLMIHRTGVISSNVHRFVAADEEEEEQRMIPLSDLASALGIKYTDSFGQIEEDKGSPASGLVMGTDGGIISLNLRSTDVGMLGMTKTDSSRDLRQ